MNLWIGHSKVAGWLCTIVGRISGCFLWQIVLDVLEHLPWILKFCSRAEDTDKNNPEQQLFFRRQHQQTHGSYRYKQTGAGQLHFSSLSHSLVLFHARWHVPGRLAGRGADLQQETAVVAALLNASKPCLDMIWCSIFLIASHYKISSVLEVHRHRAHRALSRGLSQYPRDIQRCLEQTLQLHFSSCVLHDPLDLAGFVSGYFGAETTRSTTRSTTYLVKKCQVSSTCSGLTFKRSHHSNGCPACVLFRVQGFYPQQNNVRNSCCRRYAQGEHRTAALRCACVCARVCAWSLLENNVTTSVNPVHLKS